MQPGPPSYAAPAAFVNADSFPMPKPKPISESAVRIHAINVRSARGAVPLLGQFIGQIVRNRFARHEILDAVNGRLDRVSDHLAGIEFRRRLSRREVREGCRMRLQDVGGPA